MKLLIEYNSPTSVRHLNKVKIYAELTGDCKSIKIKSFMDNILKFVEFGTSKMPAHPFLQPAFEKNKDVIKEKIAETLKEGLK
jgi:HK97 gp10 family phage protein